MRYHHRTTPMLPHPALHPVFEALGYTGGYALYRAQRAHRGDILPDERRWWIIAAAAVGALLGSRILGLLEYAPARGFHPQQLFAFSGSGKTIVGGLLGGWLAVELLKRLAHIRSRPSTPTTSSTVTTSNNPASHPCAPPRPPLRRFHSAPLLTLNQGFDLSMPAKEKGGQKAALVCRCTRLPPNQPLPQQSCAGKQSRAQQN